MLENIKLGLLVVALLPGFIFVQAREHHLLREKRPQFEKTLEIILDSLFNMDHCPCQPHLVALGRSQGAAQGRGDCAYKLST